MSWEAPPLFEVIPGDRFVTISWGYPPAWTLLPTESNIHGWQTTYFRIFLNGIKSDGQFGFMYYIDIPLSYDAGDYVFTYTIGTAEYNNYLTNGLEYKIHIFAVHQEGLAITYSNALFVSATPVGPPTGISTFSVNAGNSQIEIRWGAPSNDGGAPIQVYYLQYSTTSSTGPWYTIINVYGSTTFSYLFSGLSNGTTYYIRVAVVNVYGTSIYNTTSARPVGPPSAIPYIYTTSNISQITLNWGAPSNDGGATMTYYLQYSTTGYSGWSTFVTSLSASTLTYNINSLGGTQLTIGTTYYFRVAATNIYDTVYATTTGTPSTFPNQVANISSTIGDATVTLQWSAPSDNGGAAITGYIINYNTTGDSGPWSSLANVDASTLSYPYTKLTNGTVYFFQVAATNAVGTGPYTLTSGRPVGPPTNITSLSANSGNSQVTLNWGAPSNDGGSSITGYILQYSTTSSSGPWSSLTTLPASTLSYTYTGLTNGTTYYLQVAATNVYGTGQYTLTSGRPVGPPNNITSISANSGNSQVTLNWGAPSNDGGVTITYNLQYSITGYSGWSTFATSLPASTLSYTYTGLTNGTVYFFQVAATNVYGTVYATTTATPLTTPNQVANISSTIGDAKLTLQWSAPSYNGGSPITGYSLQHSTEGSWSLLASFSASTLSYLFSGLTNGNTYYLRIAATNAVGTGSYTLTSGRPVGPPTNITSISANSGNREITLNWGVPSNDGGVTMTYNLQYSTTGYSGWSAFATSLPASTLTYNITSLNGNNLTNGTAYFFQVAATNMYGTVYATTTATPSTFPNPVASISSTIGDAKLTLQWSAPSDNGGSPITGYILQYSTEGSWSSLASLPASTLSYLFSGLTNGNTYYLRIAATNIRGPGSYTLTSGIPVGPPTNITSISANSGNSQVTLSWGAPSNDGGAPITYNLQYSTTSSSGPWSSLTTLSASTLSYTYTGLTNGTTYYLQVAATNVYGTGEYKLTSGRPVGPPTNITSISANSGNREITLNWGAPSNDGGVTITYNLQYSITGYSGWSTFATSLPASTLSYRYTGLTNGTTYYLQVAATNMYGTVYATTTATPSTFPNQVASISSTIGDAKLTLQWSAPSDNGGSPITGYSLQYSTTSSSGPWTSLANVSASTLEYVTSGLLINGTTYYLQVAATNIRGPGLYTLTSGRPVGPPSGVLSLSATASNSQITLRWGVPSNDGGAVILSYNLQYSTTSSSGPWTPLITLQASALTKLEYIIPGLTNGIRYYIQVAPTNTYGTRAASTGVSTMPGTSPTIPQNFTGIGIKGGVDLSWTAPSSIGALSITSYNLQYSTAPSVSWSESYSYASSILTLPFTGLTTGKLYYFRLSAENNAGMSSDYAVISAIPQRSSQGTTIYKPNNLKFAKQGGVSSDTRTMSLRVNTVNLSGVRLR